MGNFISALVLSIWSFVNNKWGESLVLPTNDSTVEVGTKIYYGLNQICILNFGESEVTSSDAQCSKVSLGTKSD